jgi:hypothetical protein
MFRIPNFFEYEEITKKKTMDQFKIDVSVFYRKFLCCIITSCNGYYAPMVPQQ